MSILALTVSVAVVLADGKAPAEGRRVDLAWLKGSDVVSRASAGIRGGEVVLPESPAGADAFRVVGPDLLSRRTPLCANPRRLVLVSGSVILVRADSRGGWLHLVPESGDGELLSERVAPGAEEARLVVWPGSYGAALDPGRGRPIEVARLKCVPGSVHRVGDPERPTPEARRPLLLRVQDEAGRPLRGAAVRLSTDGNPESRAELLALRHRSGVSGDDGLLDLGVLGPRDWPLRLEKEGLRDALVSEPKDERGSSPTPVTLRPYATVGIRWPGRPKEDSSSEVRVERCRSGSGSGNCVAWEAAGSARLDEVGIGRTRGLKPGSYRFTLRTAVASFAYDDRDVPWDSAASDPEEIVFSPDEWRLAGRVEDRNEKAVSDAIVVVSPVVTTGLAPSLGTNTRSGADGSFDLTFLASSPEVGITAHRDEPPAASRMKLLSRGDRWRTDLAIRVESGGVRVAVQAREDSSPLEGCLVTLKGERSDESGLQTSRTDATGVALFRGSDGLAAIVDAACDGRIPSSGTALQGTAETVDVTIRLERSASLSVRVTDAGGRAVAGAHVFAPETGLLVGPFEVPLVELGSTAPDGRLDVPGDRYGASPVFVVAEGRALGVARLAAARCAGDECETEIVLNHPSSFPGAVVSSASGRTLPPNGLVFSYRGMPLPFVLLEKIASAHGFPAGGFFVGTGGLAMSLLPAYLPAGDYEVGYMIGSKATRRLKAVPAGHLRLPTSSVVEFRVHAVP